MRLSLIYLGSTGAGPVYSLEMAKALAMNEECELQVIISRQVSNLEEWKKCFNSSNVRLDIVETYKHNKVSFALSFIEFWKVMAIVKLIKQFNPYVLYVPFLLTWDFLIYPWIYKKIRIIATLHDPHPHDKSRNPLTNWISRQNRNAYKYVNDVIVLNNSDVSFVRKRYCKNVHVIPHASFSYYVKQEDTVKSIKKTIGFLGRIEPYKGLDILIDAFSQLDDQYRLIIAGSGNIDSVTYKKIIDNPRVELINRYIKDEEFSDLISRMDFVVLPYKRASQSGVIPLVFAHGKPVIVTNVGALNEQVPKGTGLVTEPNVQSLYESIMELYRVPEKVFDWGDNAKRYAESKLTWESSANKLLAIIRNNNE